MNASQLPRYPEYDRRAEGWLEEVPAHWKIAPVYSRYQVELGKMLDSKRVDGSQLAPYLRNVDVQWDRINTSSLPEMDFSPKDRSRYELRPGDLLVCEGGEVGRTAIWHGELDQCFYQKALHRLRPFRDSQSPRYFLYLMRAAAAAELFRSDANPNTIDHLTAVKLRHHRFPFPPPAEQRAIADFLDRETTRIDTLIDKKQRLLELLEEKRTALITRAVTKGLDPGVEMKESGVEWLGEIPAHWDAARMWQISRALSGGTPARSVPSYWNGEIPWVSPKDMKRRSIDSTAETITNRALQETAIKLISPPAVLIVVRGMILAHSFPVGLTAIPVTINQDMKALLFRPGIDPGFIAWFLEGVGKALVAALVDQAAHGTRALRMDQWRSVVAPLPPRHEQGAITEFLAIETRRLDDLDRNIGHAIDLLREYRTALISAAVTGKIDVRASA